MYTDSEKLLAFRKNRNLTQAGLASALGITQQQIAMIENGSRKASSNFKLAFLKVYGVDWDTQIASGDTYIHNHLNRENNIVPIPFYSAKASAGNGEQLPEYPEKDVMYFDRRWLKNILMVNPSNLAIIQAKGNSMDGGTSPIKDGDLLMLDESIKEPANKQIFVVRIDGSDLVVKRTDVAWDGTVKLCSNNPEYGEVIPIENAEIIGKVVWNGSKENV